VKCFSCIQCGETFSVAKPLQKCPKCGGALLVVYDYEEVSSSLSLDKLRSRPFCVWRYFELLPVTDRSKVVTLGEGGTFLHRCKKLAKMIGVKELYVKDETTNPTGSFMDRGTTVQVSKALELNYGGVICAATGNYGASLAAYAAKAGLSCKIFIPTGVDLGKLYQMIAYGADVELARSYDEAKALTLRGMVDTYSASPLDPFFLEGEKTTGFEIYEQTLGNLPDRIVVPLGSGGHAVMIWKAFNELEEAGFLKDVKVIISGVQPKGGPIAKAFMEGKGVVEEVERVETRFLDVGVKSSPYASLALKAIKKSGGFVSMVLDEEMVQAARLLAKTEGIFAEPAAGSAIAGVKAALDAGIIDPSERIVCIITGSGLKDVKTARSLIKRQKEVKLTLADVELPLRIGLTKLRILEVLSEGKLHGYGIWKRLKTRYGINVKLPSVYQHLSELTTLGLVKALDVEKYPRRRGRRLYVATEYGASMVSSIKKAAIEYLYE